MAKGAVHVNHLNNKIKGFNAENFKINTLKTVENFNLFSVTFFLLVGCGQYLVEIEDLD